MRQLSHCGRPPAFPLDSKAGEEHRNGNLPSYAAHRKPIEPPTTTILRVKIAGTIEIQIVRIRSWRDSARAVVGIVTKIVGNAAPVAATHAR